MKWQLISRLAALVLFSLTLVGCGPEKSVSPLSGSNQAKASPTPSGTSIGSKRIIVSTLPMLRVWRDNSSSMSEDDVETAVPELQAAIQRCSSRFSGIEVVPFAQGNEPLWSARVRRFHWGDPPQVEGFEGTDPNAPVATKIFVGAKSRHTQKRRAEFDRKTGDLSVDYELTVANQVHKAAASLLEGPSGQAPCTRFATLKRRIAEENLAYNLVLTDGWIDCERTNQFQKSQPLIQGKLIVLLLTRSADTQRDEGAFEQRARDMKKIFPTAKIVPIYLAGTVVDELLRD